MTTFKLLADLPALATLDRWSRYGARRRGVLTHDSGKFRCSAALGEVAPSALYMSTLVAVRYNWCCRSYKRPGQPKKVALTA